MQIYLKSSIIFLIYFQTINAREVIYHFDIRYHWATPDGVGKLILGVNGEFPGPTIRASMGDILTVHVTNSIDTEEGTSIHWHGLDQYLTNYMDGPEQVTQCPIAYNTTKTYQFKLLQSGTYWWHSHHSYQLSEGCWGILIIDKNPEVHGRAYDEELTISLNDWYHRSGIELTEWYLSNRSNGFPPIPDSGLMNGVGRYNCWFARAQGHPCYPGRQRYPVFVVTRGKRYRIRVINTSAIASFNFSIDGHKLATIEVDGVDTVSVTPVDKANLASAQRYSFIVPMNGRGRQFWIRARANDFNFPPGNINRFPQAFDKMVLGILRYREPEAGGFGFSDPLGQGQDDESISQGRPATHELAAAELAAARTTRQFVSSLEILDSTQFNQPIGFENVNSRNLPTTQETLNPTLLDQNLCQPFAKAEARLAPATFHQSINLNVNTSMNSRGEWRSNINGIIYEIGSRPVLYQVINGEKLPVATNAINTQYGRGRVVQVVINSRGPGTHPFHLHGHTFWILGTGSEGDGDFNVFRDSRKLILNGVRRDTVVVPPRSWTVIRYHADNPGVWLFHCHINWHLQAGMGAVFIEGGPSGVQNAIGTRVPREGIEVCRRAGISV